MSLSVTPASDNSQEFNSPGAPASLSDNEVIQKALDKARDARKKKPGGPTEPLSLETMALLARQLDHHLVLQQDSQRSAAVTQAERSEMSSSAAMTQEISALLSEDKGQRAKILALMEASSRIATDLTRDGSAIDPSSSAPGRASATISGSTTLSSAAPPESEDGSGCTQTSSLSNSSLPGSAGIMSAGFPSSFVAPNQTPITDGGLSLAAVANQSLTFATMSDEGGSTGDQKKRDKDEAGLAAEVGAAAGVTAGSVEPSPLYTELQETFGGPPHRPATPAASPAPSSPDIASVLASSLPADGSLPVRIDSLPADVDQLQAVQGSTDSEKKDQSEE